MDETRLFLDSNIIISGLISPKGAPRILIDLLNREVPHLKGLTGQYNLEEIERNLRNHFPNLFPIYQELLAKLNLKIIEIPPAEEVMFLLKKMSPNDAPVLASARMGKAHYLITGNKKDFPKEIVQPIKSISPSEFLEKTLLKIIREDAN